MNLIVSIRKNYLAKVRQIFFTCNNRSIFFIRNFAGERQEKAIDYGAYTLNIYAKTEVAREGDAKESPPTGHGAVGGVMSLPKEGASGLFL